MLNDASNLVDELHEQRYYAYGMEIPGIKETVLRELIQASTELTARIVGRDNGFIVLFRLASGEKALVTTRGAMRFFASLNTAAAFLGDMGLLRFEIDISHYRPGRLRSPRPDRAAALRLTKTKLRQQPLALEI
jgi:hypothetical protein